MVNWLHDKKYRNVLIEINNETQGEIKNYDHEILLHQRVDELITLAKSITRDGYKYPVSVSFNAFTVPTPNVVKVADYILFHCNSLKKHENFVNHIAKVKTAVGDRNIPIMINEDDNFAFETDTSHFKTAIENYISWGYFDYRKKGDKDLKNGFQTLPVDWGINSPNKKAFFEKVKEISGANGPKTNFIPNQDYIKIEAESTKSGLGEWLKIKKGDKNYVAGASGETFLEFLGNTPTMGLPNSPLIYTFTAPANGTYRLIMMNSKRLEGVRGDWCNDAYIKLEGDYQSHTGLDRNTLGQYLKFFQEGSVGTPELSFHWGLRAERGKHEFFELIYNLKKGQSYSITLAGRSQRLSVDYLLLYNTDTMTLNQVKEQFDK